METFPPPPQKKKPEPNYGEKKTLAFLEHHFFGFLLPAIPGFSALLGGLLPVGSNGFYKACLMALLCVVGAALAAGLTMGLVSIDPMEMVT